MKKCAKREQTVSLLLFFAVRKEYRYFGIDFRCFSIDNRQCRLYNIQGKSRFPGFPTCKSKGEKNVF